MPWGLKQQAFRSSMCVLVEPAMEMRVVQGGSQWARREAGPYLKERYGYGLQWGQRCSVDIQGGCGVCGVVWWRTFCSNPQEPNQVQQQQQGAACLPCLACPPARSRAY